MRNKKKSPIKNNDKKTSNISTKDQIILRTKAANKCSICKQDLLLERNATKLKLRGEMCHIVGEKISAARGKLENLPLEDRNNYSNIILLCKNHHEEIDNNELTYTIAKLHFIKTEHEQWVEETFTNKPLDPDELVYANLIDWIDSSLQLRSWSWFIDNSVRQLIPESFVDAAYTLTHLNIKTIWPKKYPKLTKAIQELIETYVKYIDQYLQEAEIIEYSDIFKPRKTPGNPLNNPNYFYLSEKNDLWARINFLLLLNFVVKLNRFADVVRQTINPLFYRVQGKFIVIDTLGTHLGEWGAMIEPKLNLVEKKIVQLNAKLKVLEEKHRQEKKLKK